MAKKSEHRPIHRTDLLPSNMTAGKEAAVREVLVAYRAGAVMLGREQWRLFFETGRFNKNFDKDKKTYAAVIGAANRVQMCRHQVVGALQSWVSNRSNEFRETVVRSSLSPETKHMLHVVNKAGACFCKGDVFMPKSGAVIPDVRPPPGPFHHAARHGEASAAEPVSDLHAPRSPRRGDLASDGGRPERPGRLVGAAVDDAERPQDRRSAADL